MTRNKTQHRPAQCSARFAILAAAQLTVGLLALSSGGIAKTTAPAAQPSPPAAEPSLAAAPLPDVVLVPRGKEVVVRTVAGYNSYSAKTGAKLRFEIVNDVIVNGYVIAKAGDAAEGTVQEAQQGDEGGFYGIGWKAANLRVSVDEIYNFCGDTIHVTFDRSEYRRRQGIFGNNKDVQIVKGQMYVPLTDRVQKVCGEASTDAEAPIPGQALRTADH
jgi:hypothetical protein